MMVMVALYVEHWVNCYYCFNWAPNIVLNELQARARNTLDAGNSTFNGNIVIFLAAKKQL